MDPWNLVGIMPTLHSRYVLQTHNIHTQEKPEGATGRGCDSPPQLRPWAAVPLMAFLLPLCRCAVAESPRGRESEVRGQQQRSDVRGVREPQVFLRGHFRNTVYRRTEKK